MRNRKAQGFTLIELLIVIAIIGILAAVLIPNLMQARRAAATRAADSYIRNVYTAAQAYLAEDVEATAADVAGACTVSYTIGSYGATGGSANIIDACDVTDTNADGTGDVLIEFNYGPGTTEDPTVDQTFP